MQPNPDISPFALASNSRLITGVRKPSPYEEGNLPTQQVFFGASKASDGNLIRTKKKERSNRQSSLQMRGAEWTSDISPNALECLLAQHGP